MATTAAPNKDAAKAAKLREMSKDKTLPQDVRNQYLDDANKLEEKAAMKAGVKLAKGGMAVAKAPMKAAGKAAMKGKLPVKTLPMPPMMAKGGAVKKGKK